jgi:hypothetical protein
LRGYDDFVDGSPATGTPNGNLRRPFFNLLAGIAERRPANGAIGNPPVPPNRLSMLLMLTCSHDAPSSIISNWPAQSPPA